MRLLNTAFLAGLAGIMFWQEEPAQKMTPPTTQKISAHNGHEQDVVVHKESEEQDVAVYAPPAHSSFEGMSTISPERQVDALDMAQVDIPSFPTDDKVLTYPLGGGKKISIIMEKAKTFESLWSTIRSTVANSQSPVVMDRHFNRYKGNASGPIVIANPQAMATAYDLLASMETIYITQGWPMTHNRVWNQNEWKQLRLLSLGNKYKIPTLIEEIGFIDDPHSGQKLQDFIQHAKGQEVIARHTLDWFELSGYDHLVLCAGHWRNEGTDGASCFNNYCEPEYAFDTFERVAALLPNSPHQSLPVQSLTQAKQQLRSVVSLKPPSPRP